MQFLLQVADRQPFIARPHKRSIELETSWVAERLELFRCFLDFMELTSSPRLADRQALFRCFFEMALSVRVVDNTSAARALARSASVIR